MTNDMNDLADALGGLNHTITDDNGQIAEETATENIPSEEQTPVTETETQVETPETQPEQETAETNQEVAEDENGDKYVPKGRFDKVYAKWKEAERKNASDKQTMASPQMGITPDRSTLLETELLHQALPQFNPSNSDYSEVLDEMGALIYNASCRFDSKTNQVVPTITKLEAARQALDRAKKLSSMSDKIRQEVRVIKSQQSDSGLSNTSRKIVEKNPEDMSLEEKENYMKAKGLW